MMNITPSLGSINVLGKIVIVVYIDYSKRYKLWPCDIMGRDKTYEYVY